MSRSRLISVLVSSFALWAGPASAAPILYYSTAQTTYGLGKAESHQLNTAVTNAFGAANMVEVANFATAASFADASALFINARGPNPDVLSLAERTNILSFVNAGGAVFFVGDHGGWESWDNSFLNLFGDQFTPWNSAVSAAHATSALPGLFTPSSKILLSGPGAITGGNGTSLYTLFPGGLGFTMSAVYGPNDNAIAFLDTSGLGGSSTEQLAFYSSLSTWLHTTASAYEASKNNGSGASVPDSGVGGVFVVGLLSILLRHHLGRAGARAR